MLGPVSRISAMRALRCRSLPLLRPYGLGSRNFERRLATVRDQNGTAPLSRFDQGHSVNFNSFLEKLPLLRKA